MLKIWDDESYGMERNMNRSTSEVMRNEDKLPERWTNILISFMKKLYRETLEAKTLVEDGEKVVLIYKAFNKVVLDSSFKAIGILKKEYQQKDVYVYSSEQ